MIQPENYLFELEDGLAMRPSQDYARDKLQALQAYLQMTMTAMKGKWPALNYIDLQAGPGKNRIGNEILFGSPLIALTVNPPFTNYWFNEKDSDAFSALQERVSASQYVSRVHLFQKDVNEVVHEIVESINEMDRKAKANSQWSSLNIAFLDPEGLEVKWETVEKLATVSRMDLIINFSTMGIVRNFDQQPDVIDRFFGNDSWRQINMSAPTYRRRELINLYRNQLEQFGYHIPDSSDYHDIAVRNKKNAEVYSLIFASKDPLGDKFWSAVKNEIERLRRGSKRLL